jgi:glycosyltransferase involved in cell wall biosynthesis
LKPLISIITVSLNSGKHIGELIKSLEKQDDSIFEWVLIDGKSEDDTLKIAEGANIKNKKMLSEKDNGIYEAMNKGIYQSSGDFLLFINTDDELIPGCLSSVAKLLREIGEGVVAFSCNVVDNTNIVKYILRPRKYLLPFINSIPHPSSFIHRSIFNTIRYNESLKIASDYELFLTIFLKGYGDIKTIDMVICNHLRGTGVSSDSKLSKKEIQEIKKRLLPPPAFFIANLLYKFARIMRKLLAVFGRIIRVLKK